MATLVIASRQSGRRTSRSELAMTISELVDMAIAASSGVTSPEIASGTASTL